MAVHTSRFRLSSSAFERSDEKNKINPKRMVFLSVEGDETERTYFQHLNRHLDTTLIQIEVLRHRHGDGYSDPTHVIELLDEYIHVRQGELIPSELPESFTLKYSKEEIKKYLDDSAKFTADELKQFREDLMKIGIDLEYRRYLQNFDKETDYFAVILDRDYGNHSRELLEECVKKCRDNNYGCFLTNPCFEFWLLLHLCDVRDEFSTEKLEKIRLNPKISNQHTFLSFEVSKRAHHAKTISLNKFETFYLPNIKQAISRANSFATNFPPLYDSLGSNLPKLFSEFTYPS